MIDRRTFIGGCVAGAVGAGLPKADSIEPPASTVYQSRMKLDPVVFPVAGDYLIRRDGKWLHPTRSGLIEVHVECGSVLKDHGGGMYEFVHSTHRGVGA